LSPLWYRQRRLARRNLQRILGPGADRCEVQRLVGRVFRNYARYMLDLLRLPQFEPDEVKEQFKAFGLEHIDEGLQRGKGVVMVTAHIGNWDMAGAFVAARGYPVNVLVETLQPRRWNDLVQEIRHAIGMRAIPIETGLRQMLQALRRNEILAILIDRPLAEEGVQVKFFGAPTRVPAGAATLALRSGASVLAAAAIRSGDGFEAHVSPLIELEPSGDLGRDIQELTQRAMSWLESLIRSHPDQWFMFRDMWPEAAGPVPVAGS
jgi:KDO2-lipid IV(A) lauroyltransferase